MTEFPSDWYAVALAQELGPIGVAAIRAFSRDLVLWRTEDGEAHVANAECPHYGVHLGRGGKVKDDGLACPIHGLRFDRAGRCLPARPGKLAPDLAIQTYPVAEQDGLIFMWRGENPTPLYDPGAIGRAPGVGAWRWKIDAGLVTVSAMADALLCEFEKDGAPVQLRVYATPMEADATHLFATCSGGGAAAKELGDATLSRLSLQLGPPIHEPHPVQA